MEPAHDAHLPRRRPVERAGPHGHDHVAAPVERTAPADEGVAGKGGAARVVAGEDRRAGLGEAGHGLLYRPVVGPHDEDGRDTIGKFGAVKRRVAEVAARRYLLETIDHTLRLYVDSAATAIPQVMRALSNKGIDPGAIESRRPSLDDVFLAKTGRTLAD